MAQLSLHLESFFFLVFLKPKIVATVKVLNYKTTHTVILSTFNSKDEEWCRDSGGTVLNSSFNLVLLLYGIHPLTIGE